MGLDIDANVTRTQPRLWRFNHERHRSLLLATILDFANPLPHTQEGLAHFSLERPAQPADLHLKVSHIPEYLKYALSFAKIHNLSLMF